MIHKSTNYTSEVQNMDQSIIHHIFLTEIFQKHTHTQQIKGYIKVVTNQLQMQHYQVCMRRQTD
jgi:hypothetical protein